LNKFTYRSRMPKYLLSSLSLTATVLETHVVNKQIEFNRAKIYLALLRMCGLTIVSTIIGNPNHYRYFYQLTFNKIRQMISTVNVSD
jgi:hypothetical protein